MCKLLIIDDNPLDHLILEMLLADCNVFPLQTFSFDANASLNYIKDNSNNQANLPDLIFLDLNMPDFNGFDFIRGLATVLPMLVKPIDIYILSSSINAKDISDSKKYPFVKNYFVKPLKKSTLVGLYEKYKEL